jgi:hypothetical protein
MRLCRPLWILGWLGLYVSSAAFAQCPHASAQADNAASNTASPSAGSATAQPDVENRTVVLTLVLSSSGAVRDANLLRGPGALRAAAMKAVRKQNYKHSFLAGSFSANEVITVEVKFPQDQGAPEIRQILFAGVSGCVTSPPAARVWPPVLTRLLNVQPTIPVLVSEPTK